VLLSQSATHLLFVCTAPLLPQDAISTERQSSSTQGEGKIIPLPLLSLSLHPLCFRPLLLPARVCVPLSLRSLFLVSIRCVFARSSFPPSVKDRAALYIIKDAEEKGLLTPNLGSNAAGIVVEGTAGNTGIGLTTVGNARGYRTIICIADTQSKEKKDTLRFAGAQLVEVPAVPFKNPNNYVHVAQRLAQSLAAAAAPGSPGVLYANQWDNMANRRAHIEMTGKATRWGEREKEREEKIERK
jgi:hypothetical protein